MTYPPNQTPFVPGPPQQQPAPWQPIPPQKPKKKPLPWILGGVGVVLLLCLGFAGLGAALDNGKSSTTGSKNSSTVKQPAADTGATSAATTAPAKQQETPKASDFVLTTKITQKQCFGSAGCNVDLQVKLAYGGPPLSDDDTWQVTYELTGDESGPIVGSIDVTGTSYDVNEESLSTKSSKTKISIKVTDVEKRGI